MSSSHTPPNPSVPIFNLPKILQTCIAILLLLHLPNAIGWDGLENILFSHLAFIPLRYQGIGFLSANPIASVLSPLGYSFLHADWLHLLVNLGMFIAFGKVVVAVCGVRVFIVLYALGALAGSSTVLAVSQHPQFPLVGASAAISALVGAIACLGVMQRHALPRPFHQRKLSIQFLLVWVGINLLMGLLPHMAFASSFAIAWHAHLAGLAVGYLYAWVGLRNYRLNSPTDKQD